MFIDTPNRRSISAATRGAVHHSVGNPNSQGLRSSQQSTCSACRPVSLPGLPRPGRAARAASPPDLQSLSHRHTDRSLTPRNSATSPGESPSSTRLTARRRAYSNACAVRGRSINPIIRDVRFY